MNESVPLFVRRVFESGTLYVVVFDDIDFYRKLFAIGCQRPGIFCRVVDTVQKQVLKRRAGACLFDEIFQAFSQLV